MLLIRSGENRAYTDAAEGTKASESGSLCFLCAPLWWLGILLRFVAERGGDRGASWMLFTEAALGVVGVFILGARVIQRAL